MPELHFHFLGGTGEVAVGLSASILLDCFTRQGYHSSTSSARSVSIRTPPCASGTPTHIFVLLSEQALHDPTLLNQLDDSSAIVVCSARPAKSLQQELRHVTAGVTAVDASGIATEEGADPVAAMMGGTARAVPLIDSEVLCSAVWSAFDRELPYAAHSAIRAFDQGYVQAQQAL